MPDARLLHRQPAGLASPDPAHWQARTRALEDRLSDTLHERLMARFIDRRTSVLLRSLGGGHEEMLAGVGEDGAVTVEGHFVGRLEGFHFTLDPEVREDDVRAFMSAARRALKDEIGRRVRLLEQAADDTIELRPDGVLSWQGHPVARLGVGPSDPDASGGAAARRPVRIGPARPGADQASRWVEAFIKDRLAPLFRLRDAELSGPARGLAFQLSESLGGLSRPGLESLIGGLSKADRQALAKLGVRLATSQVFMPALIKPRAVETRGLLWAVLHGGHAAMLLLPPTPPAGTGFESRPTRCRSTSGKRWAIRRWGREPCGPISWSGWSGSCTSGPAKGRLTAAPELAQMIGSTRRGSGRRAGRHGLPPPGRGRRCGHMAAWAPASVGGERHRGKREKLPAKPRADSPFAKLKQIEFIR